MEIDGFVYETLSPLCDSAVDQPPAPLSDESEPCVVLRHQISLPTDQSPSPETAAPEYFSLNVGADHEEPKDALVSTTLPDASPVPSRELEPTLESGWFRSYCRFKSPTFQLHKDLPENLPYKNRLQEYTQRSAISLPKYKTINVGEQHGANFSSTVLVDGSYYTSSNLFSNQKAAEQNAAKVALGGISRKLKDEGCPLISEDTVFCKQILNEYAVKKNLEKPTYKTIQLEGLPPVFVSSLVFNGDTYTGEAATRNKEAEQLAARAVILSILGDSDSGTFMSEIIKSKSKLYVALGKVTDSQNTRNVSIPVIVNTVLPQPLVAGSTVGKKRSKNEKKAAKRMRGLSVAVLPPDQAPPCSVDQ